MGSADSRQKTNEEAALWRSIARYRSRANRAAQIHRSAKDASLQDDNSFRSAFGTAEAKP